MPGVAQTRIQIMRRRLLEFGYAHLTKQFLEDFKIDPAPIAEFLGCFLIDGILSVSFHAGKTVTNLEFGNAPDDKTMKRMIKEAKGKVIK